MEATMDSDREAKDRVYVKSGKQWFATLPKEAKAGA